MVSERIGTYRVRDQAGQHLILIPRAQVNQRYDVYFEHTSGEYRLIPVK